MAADPYAMCPCGSGKKLKFCCGEILQDLQRGYRLRENQPDAAVKIFRDLHRRFPDKEVVLRELTNTLFELGETDEARRVTIEFLKKHPDQPIALLTLAEICLKEDGFEASRRILHRTFQICARTQPPGVAFLAAQIASEMARAGMLLAAREHLALAVRMSTGERQKNLVLQLVRFESESALPFAFRSAYTLLPVTCSDEAVQQDVRARKLSILGCWEPASIIYNRLADSYPTEGAVWYNLGLCQVWDARMSEAASSLHHAATLLQDFDQATEAETLAQQLDLQLSQERYTTYSVRLMVQSVSELLTRLDNEPALKRNDSHDHSDCHHDEGTHHVAELVLVSSVVTADDLTDASKLPESIADIDLFDIADDSEPTDEGASDVRGPFLEITAPEGSLDTAIVKLRSIAGDLILTNADQEQRRVVEFERAQARPFDRRYFCPEGVSQRRFRELVRQLEPEAIETWLQLPLPALNGKSPLEAARDESLKTKLAASLIVMLSIASRYDAAPDLDALRQRLNLPSRQVREIPENAAVAAIPSVQYERLNLEKLTDTQVQELTNRCSVLGLRSLVAAGLDQIVKRPKALQEFGARRAHLMRAAIARTEERPESAFASLQQARESIEPGSEAFRNHLELDIRELSYRLDDPADPALIPLLHRFRDRYLHKIPEIEGVILEQLEHADCSHLATELEGGLAAVSAGASSLWTPGADSGASSEGGGQLWLPGQQ